MTETKPEIGYVPVSLPEMFLFWGLVIPLALGLCYVAGKCFGRGLYQEKMRMTRQLMVMLKESGPNE